MGDIVRHRFFFLILNHNPTLEVSLNIWNAFENASNCNTIRSVMTNKQYAYQIPCNTAIAGRKCGECKDAE